jgi:HEPN domain-containing protein
MPASDVEILRERSFDYLAESKRLVEEGKWDLAMVAIHQHCELLLKYYALKLNGSYPRTHSLRELIRLLVKHKKELNDLINNEYNILKLARLEDAYISSRYFPVRASEQDVVPLVRFVEDVFDEYLSGL